HRRGGPRHHRGLPRPRPGAEMTAEPPEPEGPPLDPFAFPAETTWRFRMLIAAALLVSAALGLWLGSVLRGTSDLASFPSAWWAERQRERSEIGRGNMYELPPAQIQAISERSMRLVGQLTSAVGLRILPLGGMVALVALGALVIYWRHPQRIRRRYGAKPLTEESAPNVVAELRRWAARYGISPVPSFEYCSKPKVLPGGMAFGLPAREVLLLDGAPDQLEKTWRRGDLSRSVALHELGHIANGDTQEHEMARAIWITLATVSLALAISLARRFFWLLGLQALLLFLLIWL